MASYLSRRPMAAPSNNGPGFLDMLTRDAAGASGPPAKPFTPQSLGQMNTGGGAGFFGRMGRRLPEILNIVGHTLQEMGGQQGALDDYLARRSDEHARTLAQQRQAVLQKREDTEWARTEVEEEALRAWVETLTPEQREMARVNPRAAYEAFMQTQQQGGWQHGQGYSHLWRPNADGSVTLGDPLPLRPRAGVGYNTPQDDEWEPF